jgi:hypothetical protein
MSKTLNHAVLNARATRLRDAFPAAYGLADLSSWSEATEYEARDTIRHVRKAAKEFRTVRRLARRFELA